MLLKRRIVIGGLVGAIIVLGGVAWLGPSLLGRTVQFAHTIKESGSAAITVTKVLRNDDIITVTEPFTLLVLGRSGDNHPAPNLTDTIVVAHIAPGNPPQPLLLSLPRDLLVPLHANGPAIKINALYQENGGGSRGRAAVRDAVATITGLRADAVVVADLAALTEVIDAVGGLNIYVRYDLTDTQFPTPSHGTTTVSFERGWRWMDGETAAQYVRTRATPRGDFDRITRQQDVLRTLHQKLIGLHPVWDLPTLLSIWHSIGEHIETDLSIADIKLLTELTKTLRIDTVRHVFIDPSRTDLVHAATTPLGGVPAYTIIPSDGIGNYTAIRDYVHSLIADN